MEAQPNSRYADLVALDLEKFAQGSPTIFDKTLMPSVDEARTAGLKANAKLWQWILAAAGMGVVGRAGLGAWRMLQPQKVYRSTPSFQPVDITLDAEEEEEDKQAHDKQAAGYSFENAFNKLKGSTEGAPWGENWFWGRGAGTPMANPALWTFGLPAALLAAYGGWKGVDALLDRRRADEMGGELEGAREEYQKLLTDTLAKRGSDDATIEEELDVLAELVVSGTEKQAQGYASNIPSFGLAALGAYAVLSAMASGKMSYDYFKSRNAKLVAEEALRRRAKERFGGVAPIYLKPATTGAA